MRDLLVNDNNNNNQTSTFLRFKFAYKAAHASGLATDLAFNTMKNGICFAALGPDFSVYMVFKTLGTRPL